MTTERIVKGILIDPFACTVTEVEHDADRYEGIYDLLSHETMKIGTFTVVQLNHGDAIFVDDDGLLKPCDRFFIWKHYHQPLAGKGLILGSDDQGDTVSAKITLAAAKKLVRYAGRVNGIGIFPVATPWQAPAKV